MIQFTVSLANSARKTYLSPASTCLNSNEAFRVYISSQTLSQSSDIKERYCKHARKLSVCSGAGVPRRNARPVSCIIISGTWYRKVVIVSEHYLHSLVE